MFIGHYAVALGAKRVAPRTSLGTLLTAAVFIDLLWPVLLLLGLEHVRIEPGVTAFTPLDFVSYPISHSLLTCTGWAVLFGGVYWLSRRYLRGAVVVSALVISHWLLDAIVHRPDLPLTPFVDTRVGLGLWNSVPLTLVLEGSMFAIAIWIYMSVTMAKDGIGKGGWFAFLALVLCIYIGSAFGPIPPNVDAVAYSGLGQRLLVAFAAWVDRHRPATS